MLSSLYEQENVIQAVKRENVDLGMSARSPFSHPAQLDAGVRSSYISSSTCNPFGMMNDCDIGKGFIRAQTSFVEFTTALAYQNIPATK